MEDIKCNVSSSIIRMQTIYRKSKKKIQLSNRFWITMIVLTTKKQEHSQSKKITVRMQMLELFRTFSLCLFFRTEISTELLMTHERKLCTISWTWCVNKF